MAFGIPRETRNAMYSGWPMAGGWSVLGCAFLRSRISRKLTPSVLVLSLSSLDSRFVLPSANKSASNYSQMKSANLLQLGLTSRPTLSVHHEAVRVYRNILAAAFFIFGNLSVQIVLDWWPVFRSSSSATIL